MNYYHVSFLAFNALYLIVMIWLINTYTLRAFLFYKLLPVLLLIASVIYLLMDFGFIIHPR